MWKQLIGRHGLRIFSKCWIWLVTPASKPNGISILKCPVISLLIGPTALELVKIANRKSWLPNVFPGKNFSPHFEKQNGYHSRFFENHLDALNFEILQLASSKLHKRYMARKANMIVIQSSLENKMAIISHVSYHMELSL